MIGSVEWRQAKVVEDGLHCPGLREAGGHAAALDFAAAAR
jgi:hypothetical protein